MEQIVDSDLEQHLTRCRFCLKSLDRSRDNTVITFEIGRKFSNLIGIELRTTEEFSNTICEICVIKLDELHSFQQLLFEVQNKIYQYVDQWEEDFKPNLERFVEVLAERDGNSSMKEEKLESENEEYLDQDDYLMSEDELEENKSWYKPRNCRTCGDFLESDKIYRHHLKIHKEESISKTPKAEKSSDLDLDWSSAKKTFKARDCSYCGEHMATDRVYREHLKRHRSEGHVKKKPKSSNLPAGQALCPICAKVLKKGSIRIHLRTVHDPAPDEIQFYCDLCPYKCHRKRAIIYHMFNHSEHDPSKYRCRYCPETFAKTHAKRFHERRVHEEVGKQFQCECGKTFASTSGLYFHRKENHEQGVYTCTICNESFVSRVKLKNHTDRLHEPKKICYICGKSVAPGSLFLKHMQRHGPRIHCPYPNCPKDFVEKSSLKNHITTEHQQPEKTVSCPTCNACFITQKKLRLHIRRQHETISVPCAVPNCNYSATRRSNLVAHYKTHTDLDQEFLESSIQELKGIKMAA